MTLLDKHPQRPGAGQPAESSECLTAVVIENDPYARAQLKDMLENAGYATDTFDDGSEGARAVLAIQPDLVTTDITLRGMDGLEATRRLRAAGSETHIIVISALHDEAVKVSAFTAGADDYVTKPFRPRELRARIDAVTRRINR